MELRDLRAFATAAEVGSITRAASSLHLVQSAVSQAVKRLERELDVVLLDRRPDGVHPTQAGALFAEHARLIVNAVGHAERDMRGFRELGCGTVRVGVLYAAVPTILAPLLRRATAELPGIALEIEEGLAATIADRVRLGHLDVGVFFLPVDADGLEVAELQAIDLALVVPRDHPLAARREAGAGELAGETWVSFPPGNPGRVWLSSALGRGGVEPRAVVEVETLGAVKAFVEAGRAVTILPRATVEAEREAGLLGAVPLVPAAQAVLASATRSGEPSRAVSAVRELLRSTAAALP